MAKKKEEVKEQEKEHQEETVSTNNKNENKSIMSTSSNKKPKTSIELRDPNGRISLMTIKKNKRMAKTIEEWFQPKNYRLLTEASKKILRNGKTAVQIDRELS